MNDGPFFRRPRYHHGHLREALLDAARQLVAQHGPAGFTLADAAKLAGVTAAAPYRHFSDRGALLEELTRRGFELFAQALQRAWDEGRPDPGTALERMGTAYLGFARQEPGLYAAMFSNVKTLDLPAAGAAATGALEVLRRATLSLLTGDGASAGEARQLAFDVWALSHGVAMLALAGHLDPAFEGADPAVILRRATQALVETALRRTRRA